MTGSIPFGKCLINVVQTGQPYLVVLKKQRETLIALIIPALTLLLALKIAVNRNCPAEEIEPHLENDP